MNQISIAKQAAGLLLLACMLAPGCSKPAAPHSGDTAQGAVSPAPPAAADLTASEQDRAVQRGKAIVAEAFGLLSTNLQSALRQGGASNALSACSLTASPLTASVAARHGVGIRRITHKPRNPADTADPGELAVLRQFEAGIVGTNPPPPIVTRAAGDRVTFFAPILLNNATCLQCHGEEGSDIAPGTLVAIQRHYPRDQATGFRLGQLRGAWRIDFPQSALSTAPEPARP